MSAQEQRPWPVILLTALGAWLAAIPLLIVAGWMLGHVITNGPGPYIVGALVLIGAVVVMRTKDLPLFAEQLTVPALMVACGTLAMGVFRDFHGAAGYSIMLCVAVALAWAIPKNWLRVLLGAAAGCLLGAALLTRSNWMYFHGSILVSMHILLAVWLLTRWWHSRSTAYASLLEPLAAGWLLVTLAGLAWAAGATLLVGGAVGSNGVGEVFSWAGGWGRHPWQGKTAHAISCLLSLAAAMLGARAWPSLQQPVAMGLVVVLAALAWFMPSLGATLLALMVCALAHRWKLASACAFAASWIVGGFYYQLEWPLASKGLLLLGLGAALGALVWWSQRRSATLTTALYPANTSSPAAARWDKGSWVVLVGTLATLLVANGAIWQKENLVANGKPLYLPLMPVDPRSLMQGDYMALRFTVLDGHDLPLLADMVGQRPHLAVQIDARGVAIAQRPHTVGQPLAANEMLLELSPKNGNWVVVTDAWFFKEGDAHKWQTAKYGEFRVLPNGRALLVGMADGALRQIE